MDNEQQKDLIRFLLKQLRAVTTEMFAYQALFANFPKDVQAGNAEVLALYRQETAIQQRVEKEYQAFDLLIEQSPQDFQDDALRKCLEDYKPQGRPN